MKYKKVFGHTKGLMKLMSRGTKGGGAISFTTRSRVCKVSDVEIPEVTFTEFKTCYLYLKGSELNNGYIFKKDSAYLFHNDNWSYYQCCDGAEFCEQELEAICK